MIKRDYQKSTIKPQYLLSFFKKKSKNIDRIIGCDKIVLIGTNHDHMAVSLVF